MPISASRSSSSRCPDEDVDKALERIAEQQRKSEPVERPAESGDILVVDVEGRVGERGDSRRRGKDRQIALGSGGLASRASRSS